MTRITFEVLGSREIDRTLTRITHDITDAGPLWQSLANRFATLEAQQFATEGIAAGGWEPLSPRYAAWKARKYPGAPILTRTGKLRRSLTVRPFGIERITPDSMTIGTDIPYATYHQHGTARMPARPIVAMTEATRRDWVKRVQRYVITGKV